MPKARVILLTGAISAVVTVLILRAWVKAPDGSTVSKILGGK
jgi:hypothetical protein